MITLSDSFTEVFNKAKSRGHAKECFGKWVVEEHEIGATMTHLEVNANGLFLGFDHDLVKGVADITTNMSSHLEDKDCDGIAFLLDESSQTHLVFTELKSGFDIGKITKAYHQIIMSFIKMHAWLSLCKDYNLKNVKVHFITACKYFSGKEQKDNVMLRISQAQQLGKETFEARFLRLLLKDHNINIKMETLDDIRKLPFNDTICDKEIVMYLQLTDKPEDSTAHVTLV